MDEPQGQSLAPSEDLFEHAPVGYLSLRADGSISRANATVAAWAGREPSELLGMRFPDLLTVGTRIFYETSAAPLLRMQGQFSEVALEIRTAQGGILPVFAHASSHQEGDGRPPFTRLVLSRALERRRYERELVEARAKATEAEALTRTLLDRERQTSELREQFIAVLGHDLRNPLASISGGANLLAREVSSERGTLVLTLLKGSVVRMSGLIDNLMDFARGRLGGGITLTRKDGVELRAVLDQVVSELRVGAPDREIVTDFARLGPVNCDATRTGQLVSNLLGNALSHGDPAQPVRMRAAVEEGSLVLSIANGGARIAPEAMERLFQPFFRGQVRPRQQGLGLGLHIASEIAKAHGGTLTAASSDDETRFTFQMPSPMPSGVAQASAV